MKPYVVGFLFNRTMSHVVLIKKNKPKWQAGLLNGVGGKVEAGESALQAMIREFHEEAGMVVENWQFFLELKQTEQPDAWDVFFFRAIMYDEKALLSNTSEPVDWYPIVGGSIQGTAVVPNLHWLVPLAMDGNVVGRLTQLHWIPREH